MLDRIGIFAAVLGFAVLVVKVTRVSHLNIRTSHALVAAAGPVEIVLGELINHLSWILFVFSGLALWWAVGSIRSGATVSAAHAGTAMLGVLALVLMPWPLVLALLVVAGLRMFIPLREDATPHARRFYMLVAGVGMLIVVDSDVWLPPETFRTTDGAAIVGYSLQEADSDEGWVVVLVEDDRSVVHLKLDDVASRIPCRHPEESIELETFPSLLELAVGESSTFPEPLCG